MKDFSSEQAILEGWCLSTCIGSMYFPEEWVNIERWSDAEVFDSDLEAQAFVYGKAAEGSEYHRQALHVMDTTNFCNVRKYQKYHDTYFDLVGRSY